VALGDGLDRLTTTRPSAFRAIPAQELGRGFSSVWNRGKRKTRNDSQYYAAALAAIAVGTAPEDYRLAPEIQPKLSHDYPDYLNREYATQSTMNRVVLLWASAKLPELIDSERRQSIIAQVRDAQQSDGGWRLSLLAWSDGWSLHSLARMRLRADWTRQDGEVTVMRQFNHIRSATDGDVVCRLRDEASLLWLRSNQNKEEGSWPQLLIKKRVRGGRQAHS
jgi:hypothetical protein